MKNKAKIIWADMKVKQVQGPITKSTGGGNEKLQEKNRRKPSGSIRT